MASRARTTRMRTAVALAAAGIAVLAGCSTNDGVAAQVGDAGYVAGDGFVTEVPVGDREQPAAFSGPLAGGGDFDSAQLDGVALVNFWYAGCPPCRVEAPVLADLHDEFGDEVTFLGVNTRDGAAQALAFEEQFGIAYPSILDDATGSAQLAFSGIVAPNAVPTTLVLDREGRVAARVSGAVSDTSILSTLLREELER